MTGVLGCAMHFYLVREAAPVFAQHVATAVKAKPRSQSSKAAMNGTCNQTCWLAEPSTALLHHLLGVLQSLGRWAGDSSVTVGGQWLEGGKYLLQLALDPARCRCDISQHGSLPWEVTWKLQLLPTADPKACPIVPDDSKSKYAQVCMRHLPQPHT